MAKGSPIQNMMLFIGGVLSFFYVTLGILFIIGKVSFGWTPTTGMFFGFAILAYGIFRAYLFYQRYKRMREEE
jgi:hypothetical protein